MLIALLVVLGVDLIVIVVFAGLLLGRRRWLKRQPGDFTGAIRVSSGDVDGLGPKWRRGHGRWVRDILVWTKAPFLFRNELVPVDRLSGERPAEPGEINRLGDNPVVVEFAANGAKVEVATKAEHRTLLARPPATTPTARRMQPSDP